MMTRICTEVGVEARQPVPNLAPGFQPYDTFKCADGWVFIGALGGLRLTNDDVVDLYNRVHVRTKVVVLR